MLEGESGRFLCFCLRRSLSFRLWGRTGEQILVLGGLWGEDDMCMWTVDPSPGRGLWVSPPPLVGLGDFGWTGVAQAGSPESQQPLVHSAC